MRAAFLLFVLLGAAACDDGVSRRLVSADSGVGGEDGCVAPEARGKRTPRTWLVREGDSLRRIARKSYGDEKLWKTIADANPGKVGADGVISPGVELTVPYDGI